MLDRILQGAAWTFSSSVYRIAAQFAALPILARLLEPHDFGIVALATPFLVVAMQISDGGLCASLIRQKDYDSATWSSAYWVIAALGGFLALALASIAPLLSVLYGEPDFELVLFALCVPLVLQAVNTVPYAALQRETRFLSIGTIEIFATTVGMFCAIGGALLGFKYWSLVAQQLAYWMTRAVLTTVLSRYRPAIVFSPQRLMPHLSTALDVLGSNLVNFGTRYFDYVLVGMLMGASGAGVYNMALQVARLPSLVITGPLSGVLFSFASQVGPGPRREMYLAVTACVASLLLPSMVALACVHEAAFRFFLSSKWLESGKLFALCAGAFAIQSILLLVNPFLLANFNSRIQYRITLYYAAAFAVLVLLASTVNIYAVAAAWNLATVVLVLLTIRVALPALSCEMESFWRMLRPPTIVASVCALVIFGVAHAFGITSDVGQLLLGAFSGMSGVLACFLIARRHLIELRRAIL